MSEITSYNDKGKKHGYWVQYWNGTDLWYKGLWYNGKRIGYWEFFFNNKVLEYKVFYII